MCAAHGGTSARTSGARGGRRGRGHARVARGPPQAAQEITEVERSGAPQRHKSDKKRKSRRNRSRRTLEPHKVRRKRVVLEADVHDGEVITDPEEIGGAMPRESGRFLSAEPSAIEQMDNFAQFVVGSDGQEGSFPLTSLTSSVLIFGRISIVSPCALLMILFKSSA